MGNFKNLYVFFTTDNSSGWKTKPKSLQDKFPEIQPQGHTIQATNMALNKK